MINHLHHLESYARVALEVCERCADDLGYCDRNYSITLAARRILARQGVRPEMQRHYFPYAIERVVDELVTDAIYAAALREIKRRGIRVGLAGLTVGGRQMAAPQTDAS